MRITKVYTGTDLTLKIEGRVSGAWAEELSRVFDEALHATPGRITVDLTSVTFIDEAGKQVLRTICRSGTEIVAAGCHTRSVVDGIRACANHPEHADHPEDADPVPAVEE